MTKSRGMAENSVPYQTQPLVEAVLGADGRLLIPAAIRDAAGIKRGEKVILRVEGGKVTVESRAASLRSLVGMFAHLKKPGESVVDEFLAERRAEAKREDEEW